MNPLDLCPCGRISRRRFLHQAGGGFLGVALGGLWSQAGELEEAAMLGPHFPAKAKSVIFLFMCGGGRSIYTLCPKRKKMAGQVMDRRGGGTNQAEHEGPAIRSH